MASLNRIVLVGKTASLPECRSTMEGLPMAKFRLAVARPGIGQNEPDFIDIVAWDKAAEGCAGIKNGQLLLLEGRIQNRSFEDQTGVRRWVTEVVAFNVIPLDRAGMPAARQAEDSVDDGDLVSDLPF